MVPTIMITSMPVSYTHLNSAVAAASVVVATYENVAKAAFNGATARFSNMVESATIQLQQPSCRNTCHPHNRQIAFGSAHRRLNLSLIHIYSLHQHKHIYLLRLYLHKPQIRNL